MKFRYKLFLYWLFGWHCQLSDMWGRLVENSHACERPALGGEQSGVKVLVAGFAKTGTRSMSRALYQIGLNTYHSEDFGFYLWGPLSDRYWLQKSGGQWSQLPPPGSPYNMNSKDMEVLNGTSNEELAAAYSRCGVEAIAFDAIENMFLPTYAVSPGAKVVMLNWRSFDEWKASLDKFMLAIFGEFFVFGALLSAMHVLPWGALFNSVDELLGRPMEKRLKAGGPPITQEYDVHTAMFHGWVTWRRIASRWFSGLEFLPQEKDQYEAYFQSIKKLVPPGDLLEWDMRTSTYEDLCKFAGIADCKMSGGLPRVPNSFCFQQDFPQVYAVIAPLFLLLHWVNWKILGFLLGPIVRLVWQRPKVE